MPDRLADWDAVKRHARATVELGPAAVRLELTDTVDVADLARLVVAEQQCCAFFSFAITVDSRGVALEVRAPDEAAEIVTSLFGAARCC